MNGYGIPIHTTVYSGLETPEFSYDEMTWDKLFNYPEFQETFDKHWIIGDFSWSAGPYILSDIVCALNGLSFVPSFKGNELIISIPFPTLRVGSDTLTVWDIIPQELSGNFERCCLSFCKWYSPLLKDILTKHERSPIGRQTLYQIRTDLRKYEEEIKALKYPELCQVMARAFGMSGIAKPYKRFILSDDWKYYDG